MVVGSIPPAPPINTQSSVPFQTYCDLTFILEPPNGERHGMLVETARENGQSFSKVYRAYLEEVFASFDEKSILNDAFSCVLGTDIKTKIFPHMSIPREYRTFCRGFSNFCFMTRDEVVLGVECKGSRKPL